MRRLALVLRCLLASAAALTLPAHEASADPLYGYTFHDDFEGPLGWSAFEEPVSGDPCAGTSGLLDQVVSRTETGDPVHSGATALRLFANPLDLPDFSNHILAQQRLLTEGQTGLWRFTAFVYADPRKQGDDPDSMPHTLPFTQTGPEMSLQNTRQVAPGEWRTFTAGIQYVGNKWVPKKWNVWTIDGPGPRPDSDHAHWANLPSLPALDQLGWYELTLDVDYWSNRYIALGITWPSGATTFHDLSSVPIAAEVKFSDSAFWATLEGQNLYSCGAGKAWDAKFYYDDVTVQQIDGALERPPTADFTTVSTGMGQSVLFPLPASDPDGDLDLDSFELAVPPSHGTAQLVATLGHILYSPKSGFAGGDGFKLRICDTSLACAETWVELSVINHAPVASQIKVYTKVSTKVTFALPITDVDGNLDWSTAKVTQPPSLGSVVIDASQGKATYTPPSGLTGDFGFKFRVCDTYGACGGAWVVASVTAAKPRSAPILP